MSDGINFYEVEPLIDVIRGNGITAAYKPFAKKLDRSRKKSGGARRQHAKMYRLLREGSGIDSDLEEDDEDYSSIHEALQYARVLSIDETCPETILLRRLEDYYLRNPSRPIQWFRSFSLATAGGLRVTLGQSAIAKTRPESWKRKFVTRAICIRTRKSQPLVHEDGALNQRGERYLAAAALALKDGQGKDERGRPLRILRAPDEVAVLDLARGNSGECATALVAEHQPPLQITASRREKR